MIQSFLVPGAGLEPARPNEHMPLKHACLPISAPGLKATRKYLFFLNCKNNCLIKQKNQEAFRKVQLIFRWTIHQNSLFIFMFIFFITRPHEAIIHAESLFPEV